VNTTLGLARFFSFAHGQMSAFGVDGVEPVAGTRPFYWLHPGWGVFFLIA